ncbi:PREDICTED: uncharacterized protein LOC104825164 isoform X2 [Tarenaya hassleriana]|uniref:uncharacterized protein LOC104825164 isoform X2 n=1 Tax=Tarenaya hassleriana TaxID=28532 RepID=UPI00053C2C86|nr:PREDICTED: uncharacterized protein LOC104825164 isoform X2 [Tarenaya hassleriana]
MQLTSPMVSGNCAFVVRNSIRSSFPLRFFSSSSSSSFSSSFGCRAKSNVRSDTLRVLEWDKLCDIVASFARTSLGREATKTQLWSLDQNFDESLKLLDETNAAIQMREHGSFCLDLTSINLSLVESGIRHPRRGLSLQADQALAVASLLEFFETLQLTLKAAIKQDGDWYKRFMPLSKMILQPVINRSLIKMVQQVIDEDGSIRDSASSALKQSRDRVRTLERKLHQLMDAIIRSQKDEVYLEVTDVGGRCCIRTGSNELTSLNGLLLSSGSGAGSVMEPIAAVPLNDELQRARASVAMAEADVLSRLTEKMQMDLDEIEAVLSCSIQLDVINARAIYSLSYGGTHPDIYLPEDEAGSLSETDYSTENNFAEEPRPRKEWLLYLPRCYHPLLLHQYKKTRRKADMVKESPPVPVDFLISRGTRVLVITGPNTGGKTIGLKSVGLASMMAKSGLHVLSAESARVPWFDNVYADIGDEQSLLQSLSTFSGHLKQISEILSHSTSRSLVLLDEVGAGTNPLEGAALGMALLESFAGNGALLTMATTHHGELKTLKYSNPAFENACMEFDDVNLKPTYKILWGVPGRSNAINIAERLGLPHAIIDGARELYGSASAEINEVIVDMERFKQEFHKLLNSSHRYLRLSRELHENLLIAERNIKDHVMRERLTIRQQLSQAGAIAHSTLRRKLQEFRASRLSENAQTHLKVAMEKDKDSVSDKRVTLAKTATQSSSAQVVKLRTSEAQAEGSKKLPEVGGSVFVSSLGKSATVLKVEERKKEILVQVGSMKMKLKLAEVMA